MIDCTESYQYDHAMFLKDLLRKRAQRERHKKAILDYEDRDIEQTMPPIPAFVKPKKEKFSLGQVWGFISSIRP